MLTEQAEHLEYADFKIAVKHFTTHADPDGSFDDQQFHEDPLRAAEMKAVFDRAAEAEFDRDCAERRRLHGDDALAHPLPRCADQRKFDAMYDMFTAWTTMPADGIRPQPLVNIVIDPTTAIETLIRHGFLDDITLDITDGNSDEIDGVEPVHRPDHRPPRRLTPRPDHQRR